MMSSPTMCQYYVAKALEPVIKQFPDFLVIRYMDDILFSAPSSCLSPSGAPSGVPIAQSMAWSRGPGENLCSGGRSSISTFSSGHVWM